VLIGNTASAEAEALQQRAERKRGEDAVRAHGQAAVTALVTHTRLPDTVWCQTNSWLTVSAKRLVARNMRASLAECCAAQAAFQRALDAEQAQALPYERHLDACFGLVSLQPLAGHSTPRLPQGSAYRPAAVDPALTWRGVGATGREPAGLGRGAGRNSRGAAGRAAHAGGRGGHARAGPGAVRARGAGVPAGTSACPAAARHKSSELLERPRAPRCGPLSFPAITWCKLCFRRDSQQHACSRRAYILMAIMTTWTGGQVGTIALVCQRRLVPFSDASCTLTPRSSKWSSDTRARWALAAQITPSSQALPMRRCAAEAERAAGGGAGRPHSLLAAAAYAYRAALAQEEDALVGPERRSASLTFCLPAVSRQREAPSPDVLLSLSLCAAPPSWSVTEQPQLLTASGAVGTCWWAGPGLQR